MIDILDELTEIPFQVFWDKFHEVSEQLEPYNKLKTKAVWFAIRESERIEAFKELCQVPMMYGQGKIIAQPNEYLLKFHKQ